MNLVYKQKSLSSGITYISGDGIDIQDNTINVTAPFRGVYTQDEYDALPEEEKSKGFSFISGPPTVSWENVQNKPDLALKNELANVYRYKGSVANYSALPNDENEVGDVWNVEDTGMNYGWTGSTWDALGQIFEITSISNSEIDSITEEV